ncbi:coiled-coil domain-containing protein 34-like [Argonauta hians]
MARPRPESAPNPEPDYKESKFLRERSNTLDSTGSTASLLSILDHDSFESDSEQSDEKNNDDVIGFSEEPLMYRFRKKTEPLNENVLSKQKKAKKNLLIESISKNLHNIHLSNDNKFNQISFSLNGNQPINLLPKNNHSPHHLTPWEKWLFSKVKEEKKNSMKQEEERKIQKMIRIRDQQAFEEKKIQIKFSLCQWLEEKSRAEKLQRYLEREEDIKKKKKEDAKKKEIDEKSEIKFKEWLKEKKTLEKKNKKMKAKLKKEKELLDRERQEKAKEKYDEWYQKVKSCDKKVAKYPHYHKLGYYGNSVYPLLSYRNPNIWKTSGELQR